MRFKPKFLPTLFTIPALLVLLGLGTWQMQRLYWKLERMEVINQRVAMSPIDLPEVVEDVEALQYRRVQVSGTLLHDKEIHLFTGPKTMHGEPGYNILTPLQRIDGSVVLIDRGWVPATKKEQEQRPATLIAGGEVLIEGMLHKGEHKGRFTPDNNVDANLWFWIDVPAIEKYVGYPLQGVYIRALRGEGDAPLPVAGEATVEQRNDHLQYAITWYGLAIILLVIYVLYHCKMGVAEEKTIVNKTQAIETVSEVKVEVKAEVKKEEDPVVKTVAKTRKVPVKKAVTKKAPAKKKTAKKPVVKKAVAKKVTTKRSTAKKTVAKQKPKPKKKTT